MIVLRLSGNAVPEHFRYLEHRSSLCNSATSRSISSLILPLDFDLYSIVLLWFHATIVLAHSSLLRLNLSLMIGIAFLGYLSDNLANLPTAHCRLNTLSVVIPHLWVLSFTQRYLIPRIFYFRLKPLVATFHTCTCRYYQRRFLPWRYTSEYICNTNFLCRFWYTAPCCWDIRNSPSEVSMPFRAKGQDKFIQKSSSCREYCLQ